MRKKFFRNGKLTDWLWERQTSKSPLYALPHVRFGSNPKVRDSACDFRSWGNTGSLQILFRHPSTGCRLSGVKRKKFSARFTSVLCQGRTCNDFGKYIQIDVFLIQRVSLHALTAPYIIPKRNFRPVGVGGLYSIWKSLGNCVGIFYSYPTINIVKICNILILSQENSWHDSWTVSKGDQFFERYQ
jgi:hypothetical protein